MLNRFTRHKTGRIYLLEVLLGLGILTVINLLFYRSNPGFVDVAPHPFWLVILPIASRYGFRGGFISGAMAGLLYFTFKAISIPDISIIEIRSFDVWGKPLLFLTVGAILGEIRQLQITEQNELRRERDEYRETCDRQHEQFEALSKAKEEVDTRIVSQEHTLATLYETTQSMRNLETEDVYPTIINLLQDHIGAEEVCVYVREDGRLTLKGAQVAPDRIVPETIPISEAGGMIAKAVMTSETQSLNVELDSDILPDGTLIAAPITTADDTHVVGVVVVEKMPFVKFTPNAVRMTTLIADWCGASLENALLYHETKEKLIADEIIDAYRFEYLRRRLDEEFNRAKRYELDLSMIVLDFPDLQNLDDEAVEQEALLEMSLILKKQIRNIDLLFLNNRPASFVLLLPTTPIEGARVVIRNLNKEFQVGHSGKAGAALMSIRTGVSSYRKDMTNPMDIFDEANRRISYVRFEN